MQQYELAEQDYIAGMKYKDIAEKYNVTINTVKSWKTRYEWIRGDPSIHRSNIKKSVHTKTKSVHTPEEKAAVGADGLNDRQRLFAVYFMKHHNATRAYMKVYGCSYEVSAVNAHNLLKNPKVKTFIDDLRKKQLEAMLIREEDILQRYVDIAYADPTDYVDKDGAYVPGQSDGSLISQISPTKNGGRVVMPDKMKALEKLQQYFEKQENDDMEDNEEKGGVVLIGEIRESYLDTAEETAGIPE